MKTIFTIAAILMLISCSNSTKETPKKSIEQTYKAKVQKEVLERENGDKYLKVIVSESKMLDTLHPNVSSANLALMTYKEMTAEEKENIKTIDVLLENTQNQIADYMYQVDFMSGVLEKSKVFDELSIAIVNKDFALLDQKRNAQEVPQAIEGLLEQKLQFLEKNYGELKGYTTFGLAEQNSSVGTAYQFQAYLNFDKKDVPYFFHLFTEQGKDGWVGFSIKN